MDKYGCFRNTSEDWDEIAGKLKSSGIITFCYSADEITAHIITIAGPIVGTGIMPWGGNVNGTYLIGLRQRSSNYFDLRKNAEIHFNYVSEKLGLELEDSQHIAELINEIRKRFDS